MATVFAKSLPRRFLDGFNIGSQIKLLTCARSALLPDASIRELEKEECPLGKDWQVVSGLFLLKSNNSQKCQQKSSASQN